MRIKPPSLCPTTLHTVDSQLATNTAASRHGILPERGPDLLVSYIAASNVVKSVHGLRSIFLGALACFVYGIDYGYLSGVLSEPVFIQRYGTWNSATESYELKSDRLSLLSSTIYVGSFAGALISPILAKNCEPLSCLVVQIRGGTESLLLTETSRSRGEKEELDLWLPVVRLRFGAPARRGEYQHVHRWTSYQRTSHLVRQCAWS